MLNIKNTGKSISKNLNGKCSQKLLDHAKTSATDAVKTTSDKEIQKKVDATGDLSGNESDDKIIKFSRTSLKNSSKAVTNEAENIGLDREILKEKYISPEE